MFLLSGFPVLERKDSIIGARLRLYKKRLGAVCKTAPASKLIDGNNEEFFRLTQGWHIRKYWNIRTGRQLFHA